MYAIRSYYGSNDRGLCRRPAFFPLPCVVRTVCCFYSKRLQSVITSYSIHYTKLYDGLFRPDASGTGRAFSSGPVDHAGHGVKAVDTHGLAQRGGIVVSQIRMGRNVHSRITSYNVCYTKLLRTAIDQFPPATGAVPRYCTPSP